MGLHLGGGAVGHTKTPAPHWKHLQHQSSTRLPWNLPPRTLTSPLPWVASMQILQVPVVQSELRIPCATWVTSRRLGPPHPPTPLGESRASPPAHQAQPAPLPKKAWSRRRGRGGGRPSTQRPAEHMGLPVAKSWADAMLGWFLISCGVRASLAPS